MSELKISIISDRQIVSETSVEVATIKENVRHNEKTIDKLDSDLKAFRAEIGEFRKEIKQEIASVRKNTDNLLWKLIATLVGSVILNVLLNKFI